ncbi:MAG: hypothetical protein ABSE22_21550, partial [Xanthobacteraceae bacterium]
MSKPSKRAGAPIQIEITEAMIDAGVEACRELLDVVTLDHVVVAVLKAVHRDSARGGRSGPKVC